MTKLTIIRHGESVWNLENRFTGWMDVPLSPKGKEEAMKAGILLKDEQFDKIYVSHLTRAIQTMHLLLDSKEEKRTRVTYHYDDEEIIEREDSEVDLSGTLPIIQSKYIAERYYGDLQGLNKDDTRKKYGEEQVHIWRRSYDISPPNGESLKDTLERVLPFFESTVREDIAQGKNILIVAHGNSLRAIIKYLENISDTEIPNYELVTGIPIIYELDSELKVISKKELK